jgi:DNA-binding NarL/FixJ family response regulator
VSNSALAPTMVGRQQQLAALRDYLSQARAGQGQVVLIAGEAGVGKTRLLREFARAAVASGGVEVFSGHCYDERPAPPYGPFGELLRRLGAPAELALGDLGRLGPSGAERASDDPLAERRLLFHAIYQALRPGPGTARVLILEDLHWADQASQDLLLFLARAVEADPVLVIGTYRSDEMHRLHPLAGLIARLSRDRRHQELRLAPLNRDELAEMLAATLGVEPPPGLLAALYERTEGNPFFAEEMLGALLADGGLPGPAQRPQLVEHALPISIRESILRRVADLDEPTRAAMSAAAVIGRRFDFELLLRLTGTEEAALLRSLSALVERQLIVEEPQGPEDRYAFRHELIRAALYEEMLRRERRLRHHEVLRALEDLHRDDPAAAVDQLAYHALMARALPEAAAYSELAGDRAARVHAYREALGHYEAALEAGEQHYDEARRADLLARLGHAAYLVGEPRRAAGYWGEALGAYEALSDRRRAADLLRWLGRCAYETGDRATAFAKTREAIMALEGEGSCRELAMAYSALSHLYMLEIEENVAAAGEALAWGERALLMGEALGDEQVITHALNNTGVAMAEENRIAEGIARLERSLDIALKADLPADAVRAYINLGGRLGIIGRREAALALYREGWAYAARHGYLRGSGKLLMSLCLSELHVGECDSAEARLGEALRPGFLGHLDDRPLLQLAQAILWTGRARYDEARELLEIVVRSGDDDLCIGAEYHLADLYLALGDHVRAGAAADRVIARLQAQIDARQSTGALHPRVSKLIGLAEVYLEVGRRDEALALLAAHEAAIPQGDGYALVRAYAAEVRGVAALAEAPEQAVARFDQALQVYLRAGEHYDALRVRRRKAQALLGLSDAAARVEAQALLREARAAAERFGAQRELREIAALEGGLAPAPAQARPAPRLAPPQPGPIEGLTPRELEVLALVTRGLSNRAIAEALVISEKTAEVHVRNILGKLGFSSRTQAATYAVERGIVARSV